jgi:hypothetical protein
VALLLVEPDVVAVDLGVVRAVVRFGIAIR